MNNKKEKEHTAQQKEGNQETKLREDINSEREEQLVKPQQWDHSKRLRWWVFQTRNRFIAFILKDTEYLASLQEISWRQKSRALFVKEGDNNTRFFHRLANSHRNANQIKRIEVDGVLYEDESDIHSQLVLFYQGLYKETEAGRPTMDGLDFACIEEEERS